MSTSPTPIRAYEALTRSALFSAIGSVVSLATGLLISILFARSLPTGGYGVYTTVLVYVQAGVVFASLGVPFTLTRFLSEIDGARAGDRAALSEMCSFAISNLSIFGSLAGIVGALIGSLFLEQQLQLSILHALLACLLLALSVGQSFFVSALSGLRRFDLVALATALSGVAVLGSAQFLLTVAGPSVTVLLLAQLIGTLVACLVGWAALRASIDLRLGHWTHPLGRSFFSFAAGATAMAVIDTVVWSRSEVFFLTAFRAQEEVAFYGLAYGLATFSTTAAANWLSAVIMPTMSSLQGMGRSDSVDSVYRATSRTLTIVVVPVAGLAVALADPIVTSLYGTQYLGAGDPLRLLIVSAGAGAVARPGSSLLYSASGLGFMVRWGAVLAALNILLDLLLIPQLGVQGAALANGSVQLAGVAIGAHYIWRTRGIMFPGASLLRCLISTGPMFAIIFLVAPSPLRSSVPTLIGAALLGGVGYCSGLLLLGELKPRELEQLGKAIWQGRPSCIGRVSVRALARDSRRVSRTPAPSLHEAAQSNGDDFE